MNKEKNSHHGGKLFIRENSFSLILTIGIIISLISGTIGWIQYYRINGFALSLSTAFYMTLQLINLGANTAFQTDIPILLNFARFLLPLFTFSALIKLFYHLIRKRFDSLKIGRLSGHYIFCGFNDLTRRLVKEILDEDYLGGIVIIDKNSEYNYIARLFPHGVILIKEDATDPGILEKANISNAKMLLLMMEDDQNLRIVRQIKKSQNIGTQGAEVSERISLNVKFTDPYNLMLFKDYHSRSESDGSHLDIHAFETEQKVASAIVDRYHPAGEFPYIRHELLDPEFPAIHIIIMGFGTLGQRILTEAAHVYHFPNLKKLRITVIDEEILKKINTFELKYPSIREIVDLFPIDLKNMLLMDDLPEVKNVACCFVSFPADGECLQRSLQLRQFLFDRLHKQRKDSLGKFFNEPKIISLVQNDSDYPIFPKEMRNIMNIVHICDYLGKENILDNRERIDLFAKKARARRIIEERKEGKRAKKNWGEMSDSEKDSSRYPYRHALSIKLPWLLSMRVTSLYVKERQLSETAVILGKMEHLRWNAEKLLSGFVKGDNSLNKDIKDQLKETIKYHHFICPWDSLDSKTQGYDIDPTEYMLRDLPIIMEETPELGEKWPVLFEYNKFLRLTKPGQ